MKNLRLPAIFRTAMERAMHDVIVPNVDDETYEALKKRAAADGAPLGDWLRRKLEGEALHPESRPTAEEVRRRVEEADRIRAMQLRPSDIDSTDLIRADRDRR
jgi:plasmid stability protein